MLWVLNHQKLLSCGCHSWLCHRLGICSWEKPASLWPQELRKVKTGAVLPTAGFPVFAGWRPFRLLGSRCVQETGSFVVRGCWDVPGALCVPCAWLSQGLDLCMMAVSGPLSFLLFSVACLEAMPLPCINKNHFIPFAWS